MPVTFFDTNPMEVDSHKSKNNSIRMTPEKSKESPEEATIPVLVQGPTPNPGPEAVSSTYRNINITTVKNEGALREEIEIEMFSSEGDNFTGSLTMQEAKQRNLQRLFGI